ncbi:MAG: hypothetical protein AABY22_09865 [Nanoarchaeota archaeon]
MNEEQKIFLIIFVVFEVIMGIIILIPLILYDYYPDNIILMVIIAITISGGITTATIITMLYPKKRMWISK